ncbi:putative 26S proteasome regulatory subunit [Rhodotorula kratochvilovae]
MSIHAPSAAAPSPAQHDGQPARTVQSEVRRLTEHRKNLEAQLDVYFSVLSSNNIDMHAPLVDREGFPRADIDVAGVRTARVHIIRLRNDLKDLLAEMERLVQQGLPRGEDEPPRGAKEEDAEMQLEEENAGETPFAKVDAVAPGSPADSAGMKRDDLLVALGSVLAANHDHLRAVAALVGRSEGTALPVVVRRGGERLELTLTPRSGWGGRGLLGCHIVPYAP